MQTTYCGPPCVDPASVFSCNLLSMRVWESGALLATSVIWPKQWLHDKVVCDWSQQSDGKTVVLHPCRLLQPVWSDRHGHFRIAMLGHEPGRQPQGRTRHDQCRLHGSRKNAQGTRNSIDDFGKRPGLTQTRDSRTDSSFWASRTSGSEPNRNLIHTPPWFDLISN